MYIFFKFREKDKDKDKDKDSPLREIGQDKLDSKNKERSKKERKYEDTEERQQQGQIR